MSRTTMPATLLAPSPCDGFSMPIQDLYSCKLSTRQFNNPIGASLYSRVGSRRQAPPTASAPRIAGWPPLGLERSDHEKREEKHGEHQSRDAHVEHVPLPEEEEGRCGDADDRGRDEDQHAELQHSDRASLRDSRH